MESGLTRNMAHTSDALKWAKMLRERIQTPWEKIRSLFDMLVKHLTSSSELIITSHEPARMITSINSFIIVSGFKMTLVSQLFYISRPAGGVEMVSVEMVKENNMYLEMLRLLDRYEEDVYSDWCEGLEQTCLMNLNQPLLSRNASSGLVSVNFNPKVTDPMSLQTI